MARRNAPGGRQVAQNRKARRDYHLERAFEAGIRLTGTEVKALRAGRANINDAYAAERGGEVYLLNAHIARYDGSGAFNHDPLRPRKLLLHKREIAKLLGALRRGGATLVPLALYFNERGIAKLSLALAAGKRKYDKRAAEKERDWKRQKERLMRARR